MRRLVLALVILLALGINLNAQSQPSNSVTVTVQAPPSFTITVAPLNYYAGLAGQPMTVTVTAGPASSTCVLTWDATTLTATFTAGSGTTPSSFKVAAIPTAQLTAGSHAVVLSCPLPQLSIVSPVTLPNGQVGVAYSASLATIAAPSGGVPPYSWSLTGGSLPTGLSLSSSGVVSGTPSGPGSTSFTFTVKDSSGLAKLVGSTIVGG